MVVESEGRRLADQSCDRCHARLAVTWGSLRPPVYNLVAHALGDIMNRHQYLDQLWNSTAAVANRLQPEGEFFRTTNRAQLRRQHRRTAETDLLLFLHLFLFVFSLLAVSC